MVFWLLVITATAIACAALYYAAAVRPVNADAGVGGDANRHFRITLDGIEADLAAGKMGEAEALAAKGELAREMLRIEAEPIVAKPASDIGKTAVLLSLGGIVVLAFGLYASVGSPALPSQPLEARPELAAQSLDLGGAIESIEARLEAAPDDVRGWSVVAPAYMELQRYEDAETAYRRVLDLSGATPDTQTDLAEALMMQRDGAAEGEAMDLLVAAAASDATHLRSRFYIAGELTRIEDYPAAAVAWQDLIDLAEGTEPWLETARQGLAFAQADGAAPQIDDAAIAGMVEGLAARLEADGGPIEDWTRLVQSYLVLGDTAAAQSAYDTAVIAYPAAFDRGDLDGIALGGGLTLNEARP